MVTTQYTLYDLVRDREFVDSDESLATAMANLRYAAFLKLQEVLISASNEMLAHAVICWLVGSGRKTITEAAALTLSEATTLLIQCGPKRG
jgi:hypothetical protein